MAITNPEEYYKYIKDHWDKANDENYIKGFNVDPLLVHQENVNAMIGIKPLEILKKYNVLDKVVTVTLEQSAEMHILHKDDESYKQSLKAEITHKFASECFKKATFTQIKTQSAPGAIPWDDQVRIIGRCVVMSIDDFAQLLTRTRM